MAWLDALVVVLELLPSAIVPGTFVFTRDRLRSGLPPSVLRTVRASWVAAAVVLLVASLLGADIWAETTGRLPPALRGGHCWLEDFVSANRVAPRSILVGSDPPPAVRSPETNVVVGSDHELSPNPGRRLYASPRAKGTATTRTGSRAFVCQ